jgi:hypothetical protein
LGDLSDGTRIDFALTLIEASRFLTMKWKQFTVHQAEILAHGLNDPNFESRLAQSRSILDRLAGNMEKATTRLDLPGQDSTSSAAQRIFSTDQVHDLDTNYFTRQHSCHTGTITRKRVAPQRWSGWPSVATSTLMLTISTFVPPSCTRLLMLTLTVIKVLDLSSVQRVERHQVHGRSR